MNHVRGKIARYVQGRKFPTTFAREPEAKPNYELHLDTQTGQFTAKTWYDDNEVQFAN